MKWLYLLVNFGTILIPFLFSFHPRIQFYKYWKYFFPANFIVAIIFIAWDIIFTENGVWGFNERFLLEIYFFNLPVEEILFFICIPFACVFTYFSLNKFINIVINRTKRNILVIAISLLFILIGIVYNHQLYTAVTFTSLGILMLVINFLVRPVWWGNLFFSYLILLIPFFIVNGILTGLMADEPVVWYNNNENFGLRLLTIPIEDIFYGFELIMLNVFLFEYFKNKY